MKLVVINKLSEEKLAELQNAVPGSVVEAYKSPKEALPHVSDADAIALWGFQDIAPLHCSSSQSSAGYTPFLTVSNVFSPRK